MLKLVIGDKNLSSWSLRPWMLLRHLRLPFEEIRLPLDTPQFRAEIGRYSPSRRVPVLLDGDLHVWDSLAICEYLSERTGGHGWPAERAARALARSISAEMHAGFIDLRTVWPMKAADRGLEVPLTPAARADLERIDSLWTECRESHGANGPWLFGADYTIADAMYAPVALRFETYDATLTPRAREYLAHALSDPHLRDWIQAAADEVAHEGRPMEHG